MTNATTALYTKEFDDGAFLLSVAEMRFKIDLAAMPPATKNGELVRRIRSGIRTVELLAFESMMRRPGRYHAVLRRLHAWNPVFEEGYSPGWETSSKNMLQPAARARAASGIKAAYLKPWDDYARLLKNPEYVHAYRLMQDNLLPLNTIRAIIAQDYQQPILTHEQLVAVLQRGAEIETAAGMKSGRIGNSLQQYLRNAKKAASGKK